MRESKCKVARRDLSFGSYRSDFSMSEFDSDGQEAFEEDGSVASEIAMNKGKNRLCDLRKRSHSFERSMANICERRNREASESNYS